jgi:hypothetical protein
MPGNSRIEYIEPTSIDEALTQRRLIAEQIADISQQLLNRKVERSRRFIERHPDGTKSINDLEPDEHEEHTAYLTWRKKALTALRARENALRLYNEWIDRYDRPPMEADVQALLQSIHQLLVRLRDEEVEFEPDEWALVERLGNHVGVVQKAA